jgi:NADPH:quinone reductase-like Zn-dependent oxidoreductase
VVQDGYGGPEVLRLATAPAPTLGDADVLVRVHAAGLDRGTWHVMTGTPYLARLALGLRRQKQPVPGLDLAGTVVGTGAKVTRFAVGDEVFGIGRGSFAEYASAPEHKLSRLPAGLSWTEAAVIPVSGLTAVQAVEDTGRVQAGQRVLVLGASGGVGSFAVQIAKAAGAIVTGTASAAKLDFVRSLGADHVVDHGSQDPLADARSYDLIIDGGGHRPLRRLRRALTSSRHPGDRGQRGPGPGHGWSRPPGQGRPPVAVHPPEAGDVRLQGAPRRPRPAA